MTQEGDLIKKTEEQLKIEGKEVVPESPAAEQKRLNKELSENLAKLNQEREEFRKFMQETQLGGKGLAGKQEPKTQEEIDKALAEKLAKSLLG